VLALAPFLVLVLPHIRAIPIWDGGSYVDCIRQGEYACAFHSSQAYFWLLGLAWNLSNHRVSAMILVNVALGSLALLLFLRSLRILFPDRSRLELGLATACLSASPVVAASALNINNDYGVYVGFVVLIFSLLTRRRLIAIAAGLGMCFSKETGVPLYLMAVGVFVVAYAFPSETTWRGRARQALFHLPLIAVPAVFAAYLGIRLMTGQTLTFAGNVVDTGGVEPNPFNLSDPVIRSFFACIFILNFTWVAIALAAGGYLRRIGRAVLGRSRPHHLKSTSARAKRGAAGVSAAAGGRAPTILVLALLAGTTYVVTRFRIFDNARYFIAVTPLPVLVLVDSLRGLGGRLPLRPAILAGYLALVGVSAYHTADPLAKRLFGTFLIGHHQMLNMTSLTGECCGKGRDQLIYNLQYLEFGNITNQMLVDLKPRPPAAIVVPLVQDWYVVPAVDPTTWHRRPKDVGVVDVLVVDAYFVWKAGSYHPPTIYVIDFPNGDSQPDVARLEGVGYRLHEVRTYTHDGYEGRVYIMRTEAT
jgi:hypothetical protein